MNKLKLRDQSDSRGFTVVELMISTAIFSVILLMITMGILQISRVYYKGIAETDTQNTARNIMDSLSQAIQFNGGSVTTTPLPGVPITAGTDNAICIGNQRFSFTRGFELEENDPQATVQQKKHVLVQDIYAGCSTGNATPLALNNDLPDEATDPDANARELMSPNMRLANLRVYKLDGSSNLYKIDIRIIYGDSDLLTDPTAEDAKCKPQRAGTQFCAISELSTVVTKRVGN